MFNRKALPSGLTYVAIENSTNVHNTGSVIGSVLSSHLNMNVLAQHELRHTNDNLIKPLNIFKNISVYNCDSWLSAVIV